MLIIYLCSWIYNYLCNQCLSPLKLWVLTSVHSNVYLMQHYVIKFVSDLRQVDGFLRYSDTFTNKTDHDDIAEILLKVALNVITLAHINLYLPESLHFSMMCEFKLSIYRTSTLIRAPWLLHCIYVLCFCILMKLFVLRLINPYSMIFLMTTHLWLSADLTVHKAVFIG